MARRSRFDSEQEVRQAVERTLGRRLDNSDWERLAPAWPPPYDNADLRELLGKAPQSGSRKRRRWRGGLPARGASPRSLDQDVAAAKVRLGLPPPGEASSEEDKKARLVDPAVFMAMLMKVGFDLAVDILAESEEEDKKARMEELLRGWGAMSTWWHGFAAEIAVISSLHQISPQRALVALSGVWMPQTRNTRSVFFRRLYDAPIALLREGLLRGVKAGQRVKLMQRRGYRRGYLRGFLEAMEWTPGSGPPLSDWDGTRRSYNRLARQWPDARLYNSSEAFRKAAVRAYRS